MGARLGRLGSALPYADRRALLQLGIGVGLIAMMIVGPSLFGALTASGRVDGALSNVNRPANVVVAMDFEPRDFHLQTLQRFGVFGGKVSDTRVRIFQVSPEALTELSHLYWVSSIEPGAAP
jgi:hypothetical protein